MSKFAYRFSKIFLAIQKYIPYNLEYK